MMHSFSPHPSRMLVFYATKCAQTLSILTPMSALPNYTGTIKIRCTEHPYFRTRPHMQRSTSRKRRKPIAIRPEPICYTRGCEPSETLI